MYKILLKHQNPNNVNNTIWHSYGTTTVSSSTYASSTTSFKEFETDDLSVLKEKIKDGYNEEMFYGIVKKSLECYEYSIAETISKLYNKYAPYSFSHVK